MFDLISEIDKAKNSKNIAVKTTQDSLSYKFLINQSDRLANYLKKKLDQTSCPVIVYGHKSPLMVVSFLACLKAGFPYIPVEKDTPPNRIASIISSAKPKILLNTEKASDLSQYDLTTIHLDETLPKLPFLENSVKRCSKSREDIAYVIYTSGTTGNPKGVQITYGNLCNFVKWTTSMVNLEPYSAVFLNQASFSFDLSVLDLYTGLASNNTILSVEKAALSDMNLLNKYLEKNKLSHWVSTPSFVNYYCNNPDFSEKTFPFLSTFLFCGEPLSNVTVSELHSRFPKIRVINLYGPTETTCAVTSIDITKEILKKYNPLPVGSPPKGVSIIIMVNNVEQPLGNVGEIVITGTQVGKGYLNDSENSLKYFFTYKNEPAYKTGDLGYIKNGSLFCVGRIDNQVKINGLRIELEDIEAHLRKCQNVKEAIVSPNYSNPKNYYLVATLVLENVTDSSSKEALEIKSDLKTRIPLYMMPRKILFVESLPLTKNGKIDRKKIEKSVT